MKTKLVRWCGAAILIAYAVFALLSYFTFAQDGAVQKPPPKIVFERLGEGEWHWLVRDGDESVVAESWTTFPNKGSAQDNWQRLRVIAGRDPNEEVIEQAARPRTVPQRGDRRTLEAQAIAQTPLEFPAVPPVFDDPATPDSVFLIECPVCLSKQLLTPVTISAIGGRAATNGVMQTRSLNFLCGRRECLAAFATQDEILVPPVRAVRLK